MTNDRAALSAAYAAGRDFATELNAAPHEAQDWHTMSRTDDLPSEDYRTLAREYGEVTREMEEQYRNGFNATFDMSLSRKSEG
jgi:hypothetical protein